MRFSLGTTVSKVAAVIGVATRASTYIRDNLKLYFDFKSTDVKTLDFVGTGSTQFEGADDEIVITDHNDLDGMDQLTLMCWMKYDSTCDNGGMLISKDHTIYEIQVDTANDRITFWCDSTSMSGTSSSISINKWYHVACTYTSYDTGEGKIYINGGLDKHDATFDATTIDANSTNLAIGGALDTTTNFGGYIKNVGIWNRELEISEIQNVMYKTYSDLKGSETTGLLAWYPLEANGNDSTGSHNGTEQGDVTFHNTNYGGKGVIKPRGFDNALTARADSIGSGSVDLNGSSSKINCGEITTLNSATDLTVTAWIRCDNTGGGQPIASCEKDGNEGWMLKISGHTIQVVMDSGSDSHGLTASSTFKNDTTAAGTGDGWHHLAMVFDGGGADNAAKLKCYKNGILMPLTFTGTIPSAVDDLAGYKTYIGHATVSDQYYSGNVAQVGIWEAALTQKQVQSVKEKTYDDLSTSEKTGLVSWWGLDAILYGANSNVSAGSGTLYDTGYIMEDKNGSLTTVLEDNITSLDNWESGDANGTIEINGDGNLLITADGGTATLRLKSSVVTLETDTKYIAELGIAGGTDASANIRLDDEAFGSTKYGNGYTDTREGSNATPRHFAVKFTSDSTNTGFYMYLTGVGDGTTAIVSSFKLYKITSGNYGVAT